MADKAFQLVLDGLSRALAEPQGLPLYASKSCTGLFSTSSQGKQAAQFCKDSGYLQIVTTQNKGKGVQEVCALNEKGLSYLLSQVSPKQAVEDLVGAVEARQVQLGELISTIQHTQTTFGALKATAEKILQHIGKPAAPPASPAENGSELWKGSMLSYLAQRESSRSSEDCPLWELYRQAQQQAPNLSIGRFHDGLRQLHEQQKLYLHPWTGPLYDLPEPQCALLIGHEVAYYASLRGS